MFATLPDSSPLIGDGRLERAGLTVEIAHPDPDEELPDGEVAELEYAVEITYEGLYELAEETLADGTSSLLDEHFSRRSAAGSPRRWSGWATCASPSCPLKTAAATEGGETHSGSCRPQSPRSHGATDQNDPMTNDADTVRATGDQGTAAPVLLEVADRIATITLNRPSARNALSSELLRQLPLAMHEADSRDDVDVLILTGADPAFCAGLDLKELGTSGGTSAGADGADGSRNSTGSRGARSPRSPSR